jgi:hypothetical protein
MKEQRNTGYSGGFEGAARMKIVNEIVPAIKKEEGTMGAPGAAFGYREVPGLDRLDVLEQLHANLAQLEDLHARLRFVMVEVRALINK